MTLVVGADTQQVRMLLIQQGTVVQAKYVQAPARQRNERSIVGDFLRSSGSGWHDLSGLGVLWIPTSKTSVRVIGVLMKVIGWYASLPVQKIVCQTLDELDDSMVASAVSSSGKVDEDLEDSRES